MLNYEDAVSHLQLLIRLAISLVFSSWVIDKYFK